MTENLKLLRKGIIPKRYPNGPMYRFVGEPQNLSKEIFKGSDWRSYFIKVQGFPLLSEDCLLDILNTLRDNSDQNSTTIIGFSKPIYLKLLKIKVAKNGELYYKNTSSNTSILEALINKNWTVTVL